MPRIAAGIAGPPLYLRHAKCGKRTIPQLVCSKCGEEIEAQDFVRTQKGWSHPYYWAAWVLWGLPD